MKSILEFDKGLGHHCAVKYLENQTFLLSQHAEAQAMRLGEHDNAVKVFSTDMVDGVPVIRMEYLPLGSVATKYGREPAPVREGLLIMEAACRGIEHIHTIGLLHRDIKPANLLLHDQHIAKVSDFGLACRKGEVEDTPIPYFPHLPPESRDNESISDPLGDVYGLAMTTYRLLNGDRYVRSQLDNPGKKRANPDYWQPYIHRALRRALAKALHPDPQKRTPSARDFRHDLERARPAVSWSLALGTGHAWNGINLSGTSWKAQVVQKARRDTFEFTVRRSLSGGSLRTQRADTGEFDTLGEALAHAQTILQRIASTGS